MFLTSEVQAMWEEEVAAYFKKLWNNVSLNELRRITKIRQSMIRLGLQSATFGIQNRNFNTVAM
jgi:hypothetical protein